MPDYAVIDDDTGQPLPENDDIDVYSVDDITEGEVTAEDLQAYTAILTPSEDPGHDELAETDLPVLGYDDVYEAAADAIYEELRQTEHRQRADDLQAAIDDTGDWAILLHDNPDPDAMSASLAFLEILEENSADGDIYHQGEINHQQNKVMVNQLEDLELTREIPDLDDYDSIALLDTNPSNTSILGDGEDQYAIDETFIDILIDHHENWKDKDFYEESKKGFTDLRTDRGSSASMMKDYLDTMDIEYGTELATALLVGVMTDTDDLNPKRRFSQDDIDAVPELYETITDRDELATIWSPPISEDFLDLWAEGIKNRKKDESVVYSYLGELDEPNAVSGAAEVLLNLEGVDTALTYGLEETDDGKEQIRISGRNNNAKINLGEVIQNRFNNGGGSLDSAGAQIPITEDQFGQIASDYYDADTEQRRQTHLDSILLSIEQNLEDLDRETS